MQGSIRTITNNHGKQDDASHERPRETRTLLDSYDIGKALKGKESFMDFFDFQSGFEEYADVSRETLARTVEHLRQELNSIFRKLGDYMLVCLKKSTPDTTNKLVAQFGYIAGQQIARTVTIHIPKSVHEALCNVLDIYTAHHNAVPRHGPCIFQPPSTTELAEEGFSNILGRRAPFWRFFGTYCIESGLEESACWWYEASKEIEKLRNELSDFRSFFSVYRVAWKIRAREKGIVVQISHDRSDSELYYDLVKTRLELPKSLLAPVDALLTHFCVYHNHNVVPDDIREFLADEKSFLAFFNRRAEDLERFDNLGFLTGSTQKKVETLRNFLALIILGCKGHKVVFEVAVESGVEATISCVATGHEAFNASVSVPEKLLDVVRAILDRFTTFHNDGANTIARPVGHEIGDPLPVVAVPEEATTKEKEPERDKRLECKICEDRDIYFMYRCGHTICSECDKSLEKKVCPFCRFVLNEPPIKIHFG